jgi:ArsR family transcriptional regulator
LVLRYPEGSWVFYRLHENAALSDLLGEIIAGLPEGDHDLQRDRERLAEVRAERAKRAQDYFAANAAQWDNLRAHHIPETAVEERMNGLIGARDIDLLVDLGTGTGRMLEIFGPRAGRAVGFDISPDMLTIARAKIDETGAENCQVRQGDCANVPLEDGTADIVILHQVLHFLDDPQRALNEAARITKPGGAVLIADFGPHEMESLRDEHAHRRLGFDNQEMRAMLLAAGLAPKTADTLNAKDTPLTVAMWQADKSKRSKQL